MKGRQSIGGRLTLIASAAVTATVLVVCGLAWLALRQTLTQQVDRQLQDIASGPVGQLDPEQLAMLPETPLSGPTPIRVQIISRDDRRTNVPAGVAPLPVGQIDRAVLAGRSRVAHYTVDTAEGRFRVLTMPDRVGAVQVARPMSDIDGSLRRVGLLMVALVAGAAGVAALAGRIVAVTGLRPVTRLIQATRRVAETQDLTQPIAVDGRDEIAQLGRAFNHVLLALDQSRQAQRELIEDAAHELRTPMSSMRTNIELLVHAGERLGAGDREALLRDLDAQSADLSDLVADLVHLARRSGSDETAVPTDLAEVVAAALQRAQVRTPLARFVLRAQPVMVVARPSAIERAVLNLLDNAVKFGPAEQTVEIRVGPAGDSPDGYGEISVADRAPTVPEPERVRIFGRFHRLDTARGVSGSGLGLAIVQQTALAHDGSISVEPRAGGGNVFRLRLPSRPRPPA